MATIEIQKNYYEGEDLFLPFNITDDVTLAKIDISSYKIIILVTGANGYVAKFATANAGLGGYGLITISNNTDGLFNVTNIQTKNMGIGRIRIDIKLIDTSNFETVLSKESAIILQRSDLKDI